MKTEEPKPLDPIPQTRLAWAIETAPNSPFLWSREHGGNPLQVLIETARATGEPAKPEKIDVANLDIHTCLLFRGLRFLCAFDPDCAGPIAWIFFYWSGDDDHSYAEIVDSWVKPSYRRQGVRSKMNEFLFEHWKADGIVTCLGTEKYGEPFMKATGYVQDGLGRWMLTRAVWEAQKEQAK